MEALNLESGQNSSLNSSRQTENWLSSTSLPSRTFPLNFLDNQAVKRIGKSIAQSDMSNWKLSYERYTTGVEILGPGAKISASVFQSRISYQVISNQLPEVLEYKAGSPEAQYLTTQIRKRLSNEQEKLVERFRKGDLSDFLKKEALGQRALTWKKGTGNFLETQVLRSAENVFEAELEPGKVLRLSHEVDHFTPTEEMKFDMYIQRQSAISAIFNSGSSGDNMYLYSRLPPIISGPETLSSFELKVLDSQLKALGRLFSASLVSGVVLNSSDRWVESLYQEVRKRLS